MEKTLSGTPQQNGVAERMNRTLNERARCMRLKSGLPKMFWADAVNTAAFLINRGSSVPLENGIPEEAWSGKEVNLSFLRVFGCVAYVHLDATARSKLDVKSVKCTFVGYGGDEFGYRFWDEQNRKIIRSRDVIFNEQVLYKDRQRAPNAVEGTQVVELDISNSGGSRVVQNEQEVVETETSSPPVQLRRSARLRGSPAKITPSNFYL